MLVRSKGSWRFIKVLKRLLPIVLLAAAAYSSPLTPCTSGSLATYESSFTFPTSSGCSIGILDYSSFSYHAVSNAPSAASIILTPGSTGFGFTQLGGVPFTASLGQVVQFEIDYNIAIDPAPILAGADDSLDPPSGNVAVTEYFCNDRVYVYSGTCYPPNGPPESLTVGTVAPNQLSASIIFTTPATSFEEVGILFTLNGTNGPSSFDGLDAEETVVSLTTPEPATTLLVGFLLAAGSYKLKRRKR